MTERRKTRVPRPQASARTPLFAALRRALRLAALANRRDAPPVPELVEMSVAGARALTRREFLRTSGAAALAWGMGGGLLAACDRRAAEPRVVIVGAGIAGLNAAHILAKAGVPATVYEASQRLGGRIVSVTDLMSPGLVAELGGEFIDTGHADMMVLALEFGLELLDRRVPGESTLRTGYFFGGRHHSERQVIEAFQPLAARIAADAASLGEVVDHEHVGNAAALDHTPLGGYLDRIGARGWVRQLLEVAYVTEYGLDATEQSALNLIRLISTDASGGSFEVFGDSDERFKIQGGNHRVIEELEKRLQGRIHTGHRLESVRRKGAGFTLGFQTAAGGAKQVAADFVILCLPFTLLREVELAVELPPVKRKAIAELGYGTNAKVLVGMARRVWREAGYSGEVMSDEAFQLAWDNSQLQPGEAGGLTIYLGGRPGVEAGEGTAREQADRLMAGIEKGFPGAGAARNGRTARFHWPSYGFSKGSYACYRPGQWTGIAGAEFEPVGRLLFAGEHCSPDFQGFMNGGAESGRRAAEVALEAMGRKRGAGRPPRRAPQTLLAAGPDRPIR